MKTFITIKTQFEAIHCWPECPFPEVAYLREPHRHVFYVTVKWPVQHNDRDKEFIMAKHNIDELIHALWPSRDIGRISCEDIATKILNISEACYVSVFEDDENGAEVISE